MEKKTKEKIKKWFDYTDWWSYVFYPGFISGMIFTINSIDTLQQWKWGYWSLDYCTGLLIMGIFYMMNRVIYAERRWSWTKDKINELTQTLGKTQGVEDE